MLPDCWPLTVVRLARRSIASVGCGVAFNVHAGDKAGLVEVAAEDEVVVAGVTDGISLAAGPRPLIRLTVVIATIIDPAVDLSFDAHPVDPPLHVGDRANPHCRGHSWEAWNTNGARPISADISGIALGAGIAVDAVQDRALRERSSD